MAAVTKKSKSKASTRSFKEYTLKGKQISALENYRSSIFKEKKEISGNLYEAVQVPEDVYNDTLDKVKDTHGHLNPQQRAVIARKESKLEWISINTVELLNTVIVHYASVEEFHTKTYSDPAKGFPDGFVYRFPEKPVSPAHKYVSEVFEWAGTLVEDPKVFPEMEDDEFPEDFLDKHMATLYKRLNRVYAIMFAKCAPALRELPNLDSLKSDFEKFYYFMRYYGLLLPEDKEWKAFKNGTTKNFANVDRLEDEYDRSKELHDAKKLKS